MKTLKAHYDGKVLVPDEPVDLPVNCPLEVNVQMLPPCRKTQKAIVAVG